MDVNSRLSGTAETAKPPRLCMRGSFTDSSLLLGSWHTTRSGSATALPSALASSSSSPAPLYVPAPRIIGIRTHVAPAKFARYLCPVFRRGVRRGSRALKSELEPTSPCPRLARRGRARGFAGAEHSIQGACIHVLAASLPQTLP
jgi:hypothetical protein